MVVNSLVELAGYLDRAIENFPDIIEEIEGEGETDEATYQSQLEEAFTVINQILTSMIGIIDIEDRLKSIKQFNSRVKSLHGKLDTASGEELIDLFGETRVVFEGLREEIENVVRVLAQQEQFLWEGTPKLQQMIEARIETVPELVEQLQSEPAPETYEEIEQLVGDLEQVLTFIKKLDEAGKIKYLLAADQQQEISDTHRELDDGIDELNRAFEDRDVIMICDILEFEILPYLKEIQEFISDINEAGEQD